MREDELQQMLGGLATRLDEVSEPVDIDWVLAAPRQKGDGRRARYLLSIAALVLLVAAATWAWPSPAGKKTSDVMSQSRAHVEVVGGAAAIEDGQSVQVAGTGFPADSEVTLNQCGESGCDAWRPPVRVDTDADGGFTVDVLVFHDIATNRTSEPDLPVEPAWAACFPCTLEADVGDATAGAALEIVPTEQPLRPTIRIATPGPHAPGQLVQVEGSGFRADPEGFDVGITFCAVDSLDARECSGGPALGDFGIGPDGTFVTELTLPAAGELIRGMICDTEPGACVVTWYLSSPGPLPVGLPLDPTGGEAP